MMQTEINIGAEGWGGLGSDGGTVLSSAQKPKPKSQPKSQPMPKPHPKPPNRKIRQPEPMKKEEPKPRDHPAVREAPVEAEPLGFPGAAPPPLRV